MGGVGADYLSPEWECSVLLLIDVQVDFVSGPGAVEGTAARVPVMADLLEKFRDRGRPIVHVVRSYEPGSSDVDSVRRAAVESGAVLAAPGTPGAAIAQGLMRAPVELDWDLLRSGRPQGVGPLERVVYKPRWSAFHRTPVSQMLREWRITTVVVAGCNLPNCPRATLFDASERDYRTVLVEDATSQVTTDRLDDLKLIGVRVMASGQVFHSDGI